MTPIRSIIRSSRGVTMLEYAIMLGLIAVFCFTVITMVGWTVSQTFQTVANCSDGHGGGTLRREAGDFGCGPRPGHGVGRKSETASQNNN